MIFQIQNVGNVGVDGIGDVNGAGLRIGHVELKGNFQISLARNAGSIVLRGHQTFLVNEIAAQRNVNVRKGGDLSAIQNMAEK